MSDVIQLLNVARHVAKTGVVLPHQENALRLLDKELAAIPQAAAVLKKATQLWRQVAPLSATASPSSLLMRPTGRWVTVSNRRLLDFELINSATKQSVPVISGAPNAQVLDHPSRDWAGSGRPIPEGVYRIGAVERAAQGWGPGIGQIWIGLDVEPRYRVNNRSAFGIHLDANAESSPGSAGCIVSPHSWVIERIIQWCQSGIVQLTVDYGFGLVNVKPAAKYSVTPQRKKWLDLIAWAEGTTGENGYRMMFTGKTFSSFADHPRQLQTGGGWCSDAAGRYQFLSTTWDEARRALQLPDFSPESQDQAALWLIDVKRGVLNEIDHDLWLRALDSLSWEWASLPASNGRGRYGQPVKSLNQIRQRLRL